MKDRLCNFLNMMNQRRLSLQSHYEKIWLYFLIFCILTSLFGYISVIAYLSLHNSNENSIVVVILYALLLIPYSLWFHGPSFTAIIIIADVFQKIKILISKIRNDILQKEESNKTSLENILDLYQSVLMESNAIFSKPFFALITFTVMVLICNVYSSLTFITDLSDVVQIINLFTYILFCLPFVLLMVFLNFEAQKVLNLWEELQKSILQIQPDVEIKVNNEHEQWINYSRQDVSALVQHFKGFDCCGYFHLGKPLLTSISATFVTYIIILIQFKAP